MKEKRIQKLLVIVFSEWEVVGDSWEKTVTLSWMDKMGIQERRGGSGNVGKKGESIVLC